MMIFEARMNAFYIIRWLWIYAEIECYNLKVLCLEVKLTCDRCVGLFFIPNLTTFKTPKKKDILVHL